MRKVIIVLLILCFKVSYSQTESFDGQVKLAVRTPARYLEGLRADHVSKIVTKIERMISNYGVSGIDYINDFMIYPQYEVFDHSEIQTAVGKVHSIEATLTLSVVDIKTNTLFGTISFDLKGEDYGSRDKAITKSISRIKTEGNDIKSFIDNIKTKIITYYQSKCNQIYRDATTLINNGAIEEAIKMLQTVPNGLTGDCYELIQEKLTQAYIIYNNVQCTKVIEEAEQAINDKNNEYAKDLLGLINSSSSCFSKAKELLEKIKLPTQQHSNLEQPSAASKKLSERKPKVVEAIAKKLSKKEEDEFMCANYGENCS